MHTFRFLIIFGLLSSANLYGAGGPCYNRIPANAGQWAWHRCGGGGGACGPSEVPPPAPVGSASPLPTATNFNDLANPMAACCGVGWAENEDGASKLDCVEAVAPTTVPPYLSFLDFYNYGASQDNVLTAGVVYPNRAFVLGRDGIPLNGFYDQSGKRCSYRNPTSKAIITLSDKDQMNLISDSISKGSPPSPSTPNTASPNINAEVDDLCCVLVTFALERRCPESTRIPVGGTKVSMTDPGTGTRRCIAAKEMKLDYAIIDLCDPKLVKRNRFRMATNFGGEDPEKVSLSLTDPISVSSLVTQFYPQPSPPPSPTPAPAPTCPSSLFYQIPWSNGKCVLAPPEPSPTP